MVVLLSNPVMATFMSQQNWRIWKTQSRSNLSELRSGVKVEVAVTNSPYGLCGRKAALTLNSSLCWRDRKAQSTPSNIRWRNRPIHWLSWMLARHSSKKNVSTSLPDCLSYLRTYLSVVLGQGALSPINSTLACNKFLFTKHLLATSFYSPNIGL